MSYEVDFTNVSTVGLESSPVAEALAGLRANEARYYKNKYDHVFTVVTADEAPGTIERVNRILAQERDIVIGAEPLEVSDFEVENLHMAYVFYDSGLSINVMGTRSTRRSGPSASSSPTGWRCRRSWPTSSSSPASARSWPAPSGVPTSSSRATTDYD